jgi:hypothetical protein
VFYLLRKSVKRSLSASSLLLRPSAAGVTTLPPFGGRGEHEADVRASRAGMLFWSRVAVLWRRSRKRGSP